MTCVGRKCLELASFPIVMIPREILKKIRQIELRTNRIVTRSAAHGCVRIPTGFCLKAQGCDVGATLGIRPQSVFNRNAVAALPFSSTVHGICHNPVGVVKYWIRLSQGSYATLGWRTQSRWDWLIRLMAGLRTGFTIRANPLFVPYIPQPSNTTTTPTGLWQPV